VVSAPTRLDRIDIGGALPEEGHPEFHGQEPVPRAPALCIMLRTGLGCDLSPQPESGGHDNKLDATI
jgi:hypothetical protein